MQLQSLRMFFPKIHVKKVATKTVNGVRKKLGKQPVLVSTPFKQANSINDIQKMVPIVPVLKLRLFLQKIEPKNVFRSIFTKKETASRKSADLEEWWYTFVKGMDLNNKESLDTLSFDVQTHKKSVGALLGIRRALKEITINEIK